MNNKKFVIVIIIALLLIGGIIAFIYSGTSNNDSLLNNSTTSKNSSLNSTKLNETINNTKLNETTNTNINFTADKPSIDQKKPYNKLKTYLTEKKAIKIAKEYGVPPLAKLSKKAYYENGIWRIPVYHKETGKKMGYTKVSDKTGDVIGSVGHNG